MTDTVTAYVALGANLGDPVAAIAAAFEALGGLPDTRLVQRSPLYRTAPVDSSGPDYVNAVAEIATRLEPLALLQALQAIETDAGRTRPWQNAPRTLDLDLVLYGDRTIALPTLTVPHPRMADRAFVLRPLQDIAPHRVSAAQLARVADQRIDKM
ncbi:2-amino-4-hydroxy-6-hydroxymethyldihydropteridine diphosphokinase [uncultured Xylophilus sp.]|uniref:2-amino-4-hydroxy-6- hydroxymethyldihydropteridine diphosphokinase n=1 Tax=uncultured Xylophilus sp. TaxID=296832 RepID=UPI0025F82A27|nr:2-amino-4-hydroxy-6-hydroxymethyldihydropteridine diphosphokinase [uncultured Xylophilus sp.]